MGPLFESIEDAAVVFIGEATHGTEEFYRSRAELTKALIVGKGFNVVVVEADWPERCGHADAQPQCQPWCRKS